MLCKDASFAEGLGPFARREALRFASPDLVCDGAAGRGHRTTWLPSPSGWRCWKRRSKRVTSTWWKAATSSPRQTAVATFCHKSPCWIGCENRLQPTWLRETTRRPWRRFLAVWPSSQRTWAPWRPRCSRRRERDSTQEAERTCLESLRSQGQRHLQGMPTP